MVKLALSRSTGRRGGALDVPLAGGVKLLVRALTVAAAAFALTACTTTQEPRIVTKEVLVPTPVPCATQPPAKPTYADTPAAIRGAADLAERVKLLLAGREQRDGYIAGLEASTVGCR